MLPGSPSSAVFIQTGLPTAEPGKIGFPDCPICFEKVRPMENYTYTTSQKNHPIYHYLCLLSSLANKPDCPDCRQILKWTSIYEPPLDLTNISSLSESDFLILKSKKQDFETLRLIFDDTDFKNSLTYFRLNTLFSTLNFSNLSDEKIKKIIRFFKKNLLPDVVMLLKYKLDSIGKGHLFIKEREVYGIITLLLLLLSRLYSAINQKLDPFKEIFT